MSFSKLVRSTALCAIMASPLAAQAPAPTPLSPADSLHIMAMGHTYARWMVLGNADSLAAVMTPEFLASMGGAAGLSERLLMLAQHGGTETKVLTEKMTRRNGRPQFWYEAEFSDYLNEPLVFRFVFDANLKLAGIGMGPKSGALADN